jgi:hypothetical protein
VPMGHWAFLYVETLWNANIISGCGGDNYCPNSGISRADLAQVLLKAKYGSDYMPPAPTGEVYADVPADTWYERWIAAYVEQARAEGIMGGCGDGNFCPARNVTRGEMAQYLLKARHGGDYIAPAPTGEVFSDVPIGTWQERWIAAYIEQLPVQGISWGYGDGTFRPDNDLTRAAVASWVVRAFGL